ncbi:hypothetical protein NLX86_07905 [Streptomyces sp. A3M-1-3]|uniref:hypothetical protein n=1 Tax=Streptomyces sp. A3M-1-3 TaxID=2962044 RepID=UPI0020B8E499|nr:hypothetical protein [Streptomyces sp. A3M-1-3]MCP3818043.1 hypothetical protein [Streptomyces sp. A3M-1-3]
MPTPGATPVAHAGAGLRLLRAAVFTAVLVVLSAGGHALASCATVPWWALGAGFLAVFAGTAPLAGQARSLPAISGALAGGQLVLHALFGLGQHAAPAGRPVSPDTSVAALAAKLLCGGNAVPLSPAEARQVLTAAGLDPAAGQAAGHAAHQHTGAAASLADAAQPATGLLPSLPMLLGHLLAALATGWLLSRGDAALTRLLRLSAHGVGEFAAGALVRALRAALSLVRALRTGLPGAPVRGSRAPRTPLAAPLHAGGAALQHTVTRRGPPAPAPVRVLELVRAA